MKKLSPSAHHRLVQPLLDARRDAVMLVGVAMLIGLGGAVVMVKHFVYDPAQVVEVVDAGVIQEVRKIVSLDVDQKVRITTSLDEFDVEHAAVPKPGARVRSERRVDGSWTLCHAEDHLGSAQCAPIIAKRSR